MSILYIVYSLPSSPSTAADGPAQQAQTVALAEPCRNDDIGAPALFTVGHLARLDASQLFPGHARARHDPGQLDGAGCAYHQHPVAPALAPGFEQQRDVQDD